MKTLFTLFSVLFLSAISFGQAIRGSYCPPNATRVAVALTASGDTTVVASNPSKRILVWQTFLINSSASVDENVTLKEGTTSISGAFLMKSGGTAPPLVLPCTSTPWAIAPKGSAFIIGLSAGSAAINGTLYYTLSD